MTKSKKRTRRYYTKTFKRDAVARLQDGETSIKELAADLGIPPVNLSRWAKQFRPRRPKTKPTTPPREPLALALLQQQVDALAQEVRALKMADRHVSPPPVVDTRWPVWQGDGGWIISSRGDVIRLGTTTADPHKLAAQGRQYHPSRRALAERHARQEAARTQVIRRLRELDEGPHSATGSGILNRSYHPYIGGDGGLHIMGTTYRTHPLEWYSTKVVWEQVIGELPQAVKHALGLFDGTPKD